MLMNFENFLGIGFSSRFVIKSSLNIISHLKHAATLPREISATFLINSGLTFLLHPVLFEEKPDTHSLRMPDSFCTNLSGNSFSSGSRLIGP